MIGRISIQVEKKKLLFSILFIFTGILAPSLINAKQLNIYELIYKSIENYDNGRLIIAAFKLVILNCIRALPNYIGVFILVESIKVSYDGKVKDYFGGLVAILIIPFIYKIIYLIYNINYDLGVPAVIVICSIIYLEKLNISTISSLRKSFIVVLLLLGVQWMDIIPQLSEFGFGRGEISSDVKMAAAFIDGSDALTFAAVTFFMIFTMNAFFIYKILKDQHDLIVATEVNKRVEKELAETRLKAIEARTSQEIQNLVHDLKSPLTSIQALVSVSELMVDNEKIKVYLSKISISVDKLNAMISEILYENKKSIISIDELFELILSQLSTNKDVDKIKFINECPNKKLLANKTRLSRAIINSINNSLDAIDKDYGNIYLNVTAKDSKIIICIEDNGVGIKKEVIEKIWERGFSTKSSSGIGLKFMQNVINNHNGEIAISSEVNEGTKLTITLPEVIYDE